MVGLKGWKSANLKTTKIVYLDRDGTLNVDYGYISDPNKLVLYPGVAEGIAALKKAGFFVAVVTNQSAIGRGIASLREIESVNAKLQLELLRENPAAVLDIVLYCPHGPDDNCGCRKPKTGLVLPLKERIGLDPIESFVVGDKESDLQFGENLGIPANRRILILSGEGENTLRRLREEGDTEFIFKKSFVEVVQYILDQ